jgi:hypothetical protein
MHPTKIKFRSGVMLDHSFDHLGPSTTIKMVENMNQGIGSCKRTYTVCDFGDGWNLIWILDHVLTNEHSGIVFLCQDLQINFVGAYELV